MTILAGQILRASDLAEMLPEPTDYVPVNTNITLGNGTNTARYMRIGEWCHVWWMLQEGTTTAFGGDIQAGLPFPVAGGAQCVLSGEYRQFGAQSIHVMGIAGPGASLMAVRFHGTNNNGIVNATFPFAVANGNIMRLAGSYQVAP